MAAKKAKAKKAKDKRKRSAHKVAICELNDPRWWPLPKVYKLLLPQLRKFTANGLLGALKSGKLRCVGRFSPHQCEPVRRSFWQDRQFDATWIDSDELDICGPDAVPGPGRRRNLQTDFDGSEFYVWRPDKVWSALAPQATKENEVDANKPLRRKPGRKPKKDWKLFVAAKLWEIREAKQRDPSPVDFAQLCENKLGHQPEISHLKKWLREFGY
jgi:hypothetical protein